LDEDLVKAEEEDGLAPGQEVHVYKERDDTVSRMFNSVCLI